MTVETTKSGQIIDQLALLRLVVGYLGQHKQSGWWDCDFLDGTGLRFLETVFPRTFRAAALRSTTEAACFVHDKALGRVGNYHLFRLPPALEDRLEHCIERSIGPNQGSRSSPANRQWPRSNDLPTQ